MQYISIALLFLEQLPRASAATEFTDQLLICIHLADVWVDDDPWPLYVWAKKQEADLAVLRQTRRLILYALDWNIVCFQPEIENMQSQCFDCLFHR